ncbi:MAG: hypothetical protein RBT68_00575 [Spirochaetia bacterium]|nr:hypothetical protein [Spirochaetia bacterium]
MNRMMKCMMLLVIAVLAVSAVFAEGQAEAAYPERDITCIIPFGQGGGTDVWARKVMESMAKDLKVSITTTNVTGGSAGSIGISQVWNSPHDMEMSSIQEEAKVGKPGFCHQVHERSRAAEYIAWQEFKSQLKTSSAAQAEQGTDDIPES